MGKRRAFALAAVLRDRAWNAGGYGERSRRSPRLPFLTELDLPEPGQPPEVESNYSKIVAGLFDPHPDEWGGAYVDGDALVVNTVTRDVTAATAALRAIGVVSGPSRTLRRLLQPTQRLRVRLQRGIDRAAEARLLSGTSRL